MGIQVLAGRPGVALTDLSGYAIQDSVNVSAFLGRRKQARFTLQKIPLASIPPQGTPVQIKQDGVLIFGGGVQHVDIYPYNDAVAITADVVCGGHARLLDKRIFAAIYLKQTCGYIIRDMLETLGEPITTVDAAGNSTVVEGEIIPQIAFNYESAGAILTKLSNFAHCSWWVDDSAVLHFQPREGIWAPFSLTPTSQNFRNLRVSVDDSEYRNVQYMSGGGAGARAANYFESIRSGTRSAPAGQRNIYLNYPVANTPATGNVDVNYFDHGNQYNISTGIAGSGADIIYTTGSNILVNGSALGGSQRFDVTYQAQIPLLIIYQNDDEIARRAAIEGGQGLYEDMHVDQNIVDADTSQAQAEALIRQFGKMTRSATFDTWTAGLDAGQLIAISYPALGLSGPWLIESVDGRDVHHTGVEWKVKALDGEPVGGWVEFFKRLQTFMKQTSAQNTQNLTIARRHPSQVIICADAVTTNLAGWTGGNVVGTATVGVATAG